jgi:hypothetical protein
MRRIMRGAILRLTLYNWNLISHNLDSNDRIYGSSLLVNSNCKDDHGNNVLFKSIIKKNGFLATEMNYHNLRAILKNSKPLYVCNGVTTGLVKVIMGKHPDKQMVFWTSNVLKSMYVSKEVEQFVDEINKIIIGAHDRVLVAGSGYTI